MAIVRLICLGDQQGSRFLDGRTADGTVGLAPSADGPFTGTKWSLTEHDGGVFLECLGDVSGLRFLDGRTLDGTVGLAPNTDKDLFSGTKWKLIANDLKGTVSFECLGNKGGRNKFLDGRTADGTVGLAPDKNGKFTGTRWQIVNI